MSRLPFVLRVAAGAASLAAEKGQEIVSSAVSAPLTLGGKSAQAFIRVQQDLADLAVRGDAALELLFPAKQEEQAGWATFDDDEDVDIDLPEPSRAAFGDIRPATAAPATTPPDDVATSGSAGSPAPGTTSATASPSGAGAPDNADDSAGQQRAAAPAGTGRYALYSSPAPSAAASSVPTPSTVTDGAEVPAELPAAVARIDYPELTLAQLRGRLSSLTTDDVRTLLEFERTHRTRAPFLTMLENRLTK